MPPRALGRKGAGKAYHRRQKDTRKRETKTYHNATEKGQEQRKKAKNSSERIGPPISQKMRTENDPKKQPVRREP